MVVRHAGGCGGGEDQCRLPGRGARWEDVQRCQDWIAGFQCLFVASPDRSLVDQVRRHVTWMPVLSASAKAFRGYPSVTALVEGCGPAVLDRLMYGFQVEPSNGWSACPR